MNVDFKIAEQTVNWFVRMCDKDELVFLYCFDDN